MKNDGGPAFPTTPHRDMHGNRAPQKGELEGGLTIRDAFAAACLTGVMAMADYAPPRNPPTEDWKTATARDCYAYADAMLKERNKLD